MIVARVYDAKPESSAVGSCLIAGYEKWFPVESFGFGFDPKLGEKKDTDSTGQPKTNTQNRSQTGGTSVSDAEKESARIRLEKPVDTATSYLMKMAFEDRKKKKCNDSSRMADIHVLGTIHLKGTAHILPTVMVHIERVLVKGWDLNASGDERPSESVELWYDRASMKYVHTDAKGVNKEFSPQGWDQYENVAWTWPDSKFKEFI
jgi:type VI protein secretion system component Hcp